MCCAALKLEVFRFCCFVRLCLFTAVLCGLLFFVVLSDYYLLVVYFGLRGWFVLLLVQFVWISLFILVLFVVDVVWCDGC